MKTVLRTLVRLLFKPLLSPRVPIAVQRAGSRLAGVLSPLPPGFQATQILMNGVEGRRYRSHSSENGRVLLFLHGGAYVLGGPASHRGLAAQLGHAAGATTYLADYSLAPEHPYPAATEDAIAVYRWLLQHYTPGHIVIAGDSAGGNLALATAMLIRDKGLPQPAALALLSPWLDLSHSGDSARSRAQRDPMLRVDWLAACARLYAPNLAPDDARISPLFGALQGLPPLLIHVGSEEVVLSDSERLLERARAAGVEAQLRVFEGMWHDFQIHAGQLAEADESIAELGRFMRERTKTVVSDQSSVVGKKRPASVERLT
ncbi:MAG: alpha/beta hydrolase [Nevskia sp.]|nr:alpha/beta hydrolase [Nevskia sp.]